MSAAVTTFTPAPAAADDTPKTAEHAAKFVRPPTLAAERPECDAYLANQLRRLQRYADAGNLNGLLATLARMLQSRACRLVAAAKANDKFKSQKRSDKTVLKVIERMNPWTGTD